MIKNFFLTIVQFCCSTYSDINFDLSRKQIKRKISSVSIYVIFFLSNTFAQNSGLNFVLSNQLDGDDILYIAKDYVSLEPGFSYTASGIDKTFEATIDKGLVFPPIDYTVKKTDGTFSSNPQDGVIVGAVPGSGGVSESGNASYSIPISVPAGINGMQPSISLFYNSQSKHGIAGVGWSISGISTITKTIRDIYTDNAIKGIEDDIKVFALDGQRMVEKEVVNLNSMYSGSDCSDESTDFLWELVGSTYETTNKDYSKIESFGVASFMQDPGSCGPWQLIVKGPASFKVTLKNGLVKEYRVTSDVYDHSNSHPLTWNLKKVTDLNGNSILYNYNTIDGETVLKNIVFAGTSSSVPTDSVVFHYIVKPIDYYYIGSTQRINSLLLSDIQVKHLSTTLKKYELNYTLRNNKYYLSNISMTGVGNTKVGATTFEYGSDNTVVVSNALDIPIPASYQNVPNNLKSWMSADVDGDGISDVLSIFPYTNGGTTTNILQVMKSVVTNNQVAFQNGDSYTLPANFSYNDLKSLNASVILGDFYGENKDRIMVPEITSSAGTNYIKFNILGSETLQQTLLTGTQMPVYAVGDINNDGKDEIIYVEKSLIDNAYPGKIVHNVNGQIFWEDFYITLAESPEGLIIDDFNNDGLLDIVVLNSNGYQILKNAGGNRQINGVLQPSFVEKGTKNSDVKSDCPIVKTGDFNGDGLVDFVLKTFTVTSGVYNYVWKVAINNGNWGFNISNGELYTSPTDNKDFRHNKQPDCLVTDFDRDGKSDIIISDVSYNYSSNPVWVGDDFETHYLYQCTYVNWRRSNSSSFGFSEHNISTTDEDSQYNKNFLLQGDFNGDGREDILVYGRSLLTDNTKSDKLYLHGTFNEGFNANLLTKATNAMGGDVQFTYRPLTHTTASDNSTFYSKGTGSTYPIADIQAPLYCVETMSVPNGQGGRLTTRYSYSGARAHLAGGGGLGFTGTTQVNSSYNRKTTISYEINTSTLTPNKVTRYTTTANNSPIAKSESELSSTKTGAITESKVSKTTETDYLTGLSSVTEYLIYDTYGNPTSIKTTKGDVVSTVANTYIQKGSWCPNKPESITVTSTKGTDVVTRNTAYTYDDKGNLLTRTTDAGDVNQVTETYSQYNRFGLPLVLQVTANGATRTASVTYTGSGRFVETQTNALGETTTFQWNETRGILNSVENRIGTTKYSYDGLGQLKLIIDPAGIRTATAVQWAESGNPYNASYYVYSETAGTSPVKVWYDSFGREVVKEATGLNNNVSRVFTEYDALGRVYRVSEPTFGTAAERWAATNSLYDEYGRLKTVTTPIGQTTTTYSGLTTTVTAPNGTQQTVLNTAGQVATSVVNGKSVSYTYYPDGQTKTVTPQNGKTLSFTYNKQGKQSTMDDPDLGLITTVYNGFGELTSESRLIHKNQGAINTTYIYQPTTGLLDTKTCGDETTSYYYDNLKRLSWVEYDWKHIQGYTYDDYDRVTKVTDEITGNYFEKNIRYDAYGRVLGYTFPSGYSVTNKYDVCGNLTEVTDNSNRPVWKALEANARGQLTREKKNTVETTYGYDDAKGGLLTSISAPNIINYSYTYDAKFNPHTRTDALTSQTETFVYDELNRLTNWNVTNATTGAVIKNNSVSYQSTSGNIGTKTNMEDDQSITLSYDDAVHPHRLWTVEGDSDQIPSTDMNIAYTDFNKVSSITEGYKSYHITYGVDNQRRKSEYTVMGYTKTHYYMGDYEEETDNAGNIKKIHYLSGGAVMINNNGVETLYYGYTDSQGSLIALTDVNGNVVEKYAYDPWGARRNPANWGEKDNRTAWITNRGYTGHEHLDMFGAINMNGRVYDPSTAQFFSPDPFVQSAGNWANYNRYSYCMNNPMIYTDPSGYAHKSYEQAAREAGSQDYWDGRATTFFGPYGRGGGGFTSWSYSSNGGYSSGYYDGPAGWNPGVITAMGSITWNYGTQRFEYGNGQAASNNDLTDLFKGYAASGDLTSYSGSSLGYDHLYGMNIGGDVRLAGSIGGEITGVSNGFFDVTNNAFAAVLATNGDVNVWGDNNTLSKLTTALAGINGMAGFINGQNEFNWSHLTNAQRNKIAYNIQKELKANGQRVLTKEIKAGIKARFKSTSRKLGVVGFVLIGANIYNNGGVKPSDVVNGIVTGVGMTGWGAPFAAGYFIIDIGVSAFNNGQGLSEIIDDQLGY